jgi:hypothetical protein
MSGGDKRIELELLIALSRPTHKSAMIKLPTLLTWFVHDMLDFDVAADISRLQDVRNRKVLSTSCVIAIR